MKYFVLARLAPAGLALASLACPAAAQVLPDTVRDTTSPKRVDSPAGKLALNVGLTRYEANLTWSAGPSRETPLSELRYRGMGTNRASFGAQYRIGDATAGFWLLGGELTISRISDGRVRDSDFDTGNGSETSRIESQVTGTDAWSASVAVGRRWPVSRSEGSPWVSLWLGWERERQVIRMQDGVWVISTKPDTTPLSGLDSGYRTRWQGLWAAVEPAFQAGRGHLLLRLAGHFPAWYSADGTWNLRTDLAQPVSFAHSASGWGYDIQLGYRYPLGLLSGLMVSARYLHLRAGNGLDTTFLASGTTTRLTLRRVSLQALGLTLTMTKSF